jgi:hypothetical protein
MQIYDILNFKNGVFWIENAGYGILDIREGFSGLRKYGLCFLEY